MAQQHAAWEEWIRNPVIRGWFGRAFGHPTDVQLRAWPAIQDAQAVLIAAPTGSGKTLAGMLPCLDRIVEAKLRDGGDTGHTGHMDRRGVRLLYITPLKALNNDVHHHLFGFVAEMEAYAREQALPWPGLTVGIRTGDTTQSTRASMIKHPPDVLVTTPESLYLLLGSEKARAMLQTVEQVIVDEIHQLAADKRGLHLSVTLERLNAWCGRELQRIGVSATIQPLERVAAFLVGYDEAGHERPSVLVRSRMDKQFELSVAIPESTRRRRSGNDEAVWGPLLDLLTAKMEGARSVLIFVNNRRLCERITLRLNDHVGYEMARSHHGSVSREKRLDVERALKAGELRCLVATASLELGIDVGHIDLVLQIDSPQSAAAGIQRIGRAGHSVGDVSRGVIVAREPGALAECALLARDIAARAIEDIRIPEGDGDVLAQQLVAMAAAGPVAAERAYALLRRSYGYRALTRSRLAGLLQVLSGYYPFSKPLLDWERYDNGSAKQAHHAESELTGTLAARSNTKMAAILGAGTIPQSTAYAVYHHESRVQLGELDEEFIHESRVGDVFMLGTSSWMIQSIQNDRVTVREATNEFSEIPFWRGEGTGRSIEVSRRIGAMIGELLERMPPEEEEPDESADTTDATPLPAEAVEWLMANFAMEASAAEQLVSLVRRQRRACGVPTDRNIVIEQYKDDAGHVHLVIHSLLGRKVNRTWQLVLQRVLDQALPYRFFSYVKENGIEFVFPEWDSSWTELILGVTAEKVEPLLRESIAGSPLFGAAFRRLAETSLLLARNYGRTPLWVKRLRSEALLRDALPFADEFPLIREAMDVCLEDMLDAGSLMQTLEGIASGAIHVSVHRSMAPSPYAMQFLFEFTNQQIYESDALAKDIQLQLMAINKDAAVRAFGTTAMKQLIETLDPQGTGEWTDNVPKAVENAADLYKVLKQRGDSTEDELRKLIGEDRAASISPWIGELQAKDRVKQIGLAGEERWICADEAATYAAFPQDPQSVRFIVGRYVDRQLYVTEEQLEQRFGLPDKDAERLLARWAEEGLVERSPFADEGEALWTSSKAAEQMVRLSARELRHQAEPVEAARLSERILKLQLIQHDDADAYASLAPTDKLRGVIEKLQGLYLPLSHWETILFPTRLPDYRKETLDQLCALGEVIWLGRKAEGDKEGKIAFFLTESKSLYRPFLNRTPPERPESLALVERLREKGASFLTALSRDTGLLPSELLEELVRLAWDGYVSNDQFAPMRLHGASGGSKPAARTSARTGGARSSAKFQSGLGRWYLLETLDVQEPEGGPNDTISDPTSTRQTDTVLTGWIQHLMNSYGLFTKHMLADRLDVAPDRLNEPIRQLETWGLLTRGLWVRGVQELQYSTPPDVEALRQPLPATGGETSWVVLSAVDPANPYGLLVPWPEVAESEPGQGTAPAFARRAGHFVVLRLGRPILWIENNGRRIYELIPESAPAADRSKDAVYLRSIQAMIRALFRLSGIRKLVVDTWNGVPIADSDAARLFERLGAERDRGSAVLWLSSLSGNGASMQASRTRS